MVISLVFKIAYPILVSIVILAFGSRIRTWIQKLAIRIHFRLYPRNGWYSRKMNTILRKEKRGRIQMDTPFVAKISRFLQRVGASAPQNFDKRISAIESMVPELKKIIKKHRGVR